MAQSSWTRSYLLEEIHCYLESFEDEHKGRKYEGVFLNRHCKSNHHYECLGKWFSLRLEVHCKCSCHYKNHIQKELEIDDDTSDDDDTFPCAIISTR
jgi:hypothetical protein